MAVYFAYGSNMSRLRLIRRVGGVNVLGVARLVGFGHRFDKKGSDGTAKGNIVRCSEQEVWGVAYELAHSQIEVLDGHEGGYRRQSLRIRPRTGEPLQAYSYEAVLLDSDLEPTAQYLSYYVTGSREHDLPETYLRAILPAWFRY